MSKKVTWHWQGDGSMRIEIVDTNYWATLHRVGMQTYAVNSSRPAERSPQHRAFFFEELREAWGDYLARLFAEVDK